ncbi:transposase [Streptomyces sp. NPDC005811]|uniref:transposase n=1 Tax=Streptomyces sp. NPDC005811 TaxID=3154565 RepID=UPI0033EBBD7D
MELERRNCWSPAEALGHGGPHRLQHFLSHGAWDHDLARDRPVAWAAGELTEDEAVLVVDETGDAKSSTNCVGTAHQYSGALGGVGLRQVAVQAMGLDKLPSASWQVNAGWMLATNLACDLDARLRLRNRGQDLQLPCQYDSLAYRRRSAVEMPQSTTSMALPHHETGVTRHSPTPQPCLGVGPEGVARTRSYTRRPAHGHRASRFAP